MKIVALVADFADKNEVGKRRIFLDPMLLSNFSLAVNAVAPMAVLLAIGALIRRRNWMNGSELKRL